nr:phosphotransferase [Novosphingobium jiangmenense]
MHGAAGILAQHYGLVGRIATLTAERDENFRVSAAGGAFVLKVFAPETPLDEAEMLSEVLRHLEANAPDLPVPRLALASGGEPVVRLPDGRGGQRFAVLYSFMPGRPMMDSVRSARQAHGCGVLAARLALALRDFSHPAMHRRLIWDLRRRPELREVAASLPEVPFAHFVMPFIERFAGETGAQLEMLPMQFGHNDLNARNVIVDSNNDDVPTGIIDFGDAIHTARACDIAIALVGQMHHPDSAERMMEAFTAGYDVISPLSPGERRLVPPLVAARIVQNVVMTAFYQRKAPKSQHFAGFDNSYFGWRIAFAEKLDARFA